MRGTNSKHKTSHPNTTFSGAASERNRSEKSKPSKGTSILATKSTYRISTFQLTLEREVRKEQHLFQGQKGENTPISPILIDLGSALLDMLFNFGLPIDWT